MSLVLRSVVFVSVVIAFSVHGAWLHHSSAQDPGSVAAATFTRGDFSVSRGNFNRQSIYDHWISEVRGDRPLTYPALRFDQNARVGDVGIADAAIKLTMVQRLTKSNYLLTRSDLSNRSQKTLLFQFRGFDFTNIPAGTQVSTPKLCQITGSRKFKDKQKRIQTALVVEVLEPKDLALPVGRSTDEIAALKEKRTPGGAPSDTLKNRSASKPSTNDSTRDEQPPRFEQRKWLTRSGDRSINGTLVGVGGEAVWIKITGGKILRIELNALHPKDRDHAIKKKQAILDYRRTR